MRITSTIFGLTLALASPVLATPALADPCGDLIDRVGAATEATVVRRTADFAEFTTRDGIGLTLACDELSAAGAQFKGQTLPDAYFTLLGKAGHAVNGLPAEAIAEAGRTARASAETKRHSQIDLGKALVTCSLSRMSDVPVTTCAAIDKDDRT
ncbi:hypothetical protein PMNALOAF_1319 [Methylobacterium adhaesivum]|uniref:Uncharacterized protein n=1 Tax=Methylobacterium adhaesivum TaxID=333297 RepID=A0ABT8BJH6_9HYPH|nr:hypothetical protein [Methylobacterium adhaesivum]MDN3591324.1 hypothetical protein [Methylobacterium adhaesivum]GJD30075.1 hypothetical protein PMNALOAF_1319 [Methylobacterium adhaesivum]